MSAATEPQPACGHPIDEDGRGRHSFKCGCVTCETCGALIEECEDDATSRLQALRQVVERTLPKPEPLAQDPSLYGDFPGWWRDYLPRPAKISRTSSTFTCGLRSPHDAHVYGDVWSQRKCAGVMGTIPAVPASVHQEKIDRWEREVEQDKERIKEASDRILANKRRIWEHTQMRVMAEKFEVED